MLSVINLKWKKIRFLITGDLNINLFNIDSDECFKKFISIMLSKFFQPYILQPSTIITDNITSLIDNILFNSVEHEALSGGLF